MPRINAVSFHEDHSIESICRKALASGFDSIEVSRPPFFPRLTTRGTRSRFRDWCCEQKLSLYGFDCWVEVLPFSAMQESTEDFRQAIRFAVDLDLKTVISHDSWLRDNGNRSRTECLRANSELFRRIANDCSDAGLELLIEPHPDTLSMENSWCIDFLDGLECDKVGLVYDCCHYGVGQPTSYVESIGILGNRIRHVHFSDGDADTYALHLPIGEGVLNLSAVIRSLRDIQFRGTVTNDLFNYPLLEDGARRNAPLMRAVEAELQLPTHR
jgi:sugar phosphate isomerase/epimerase